MVYHFTLAGLSILGLTLASVFPRIQSLAWVRPDFLLILAVFNAMFRGSVHGGMMGFLIGLLEDCFYGRFLGLNALAKCVVCILCGSMSKSIFRENLWVPVMNVLMASLLSMGIVYLFGYLAGARWYLSSIIDQMFFEVVINVCLVPFLYGAYYQFAVRHIQNQEGIDT